MRLSNKSMGLFSKARRSKFGIGTALFLMAMGVVFTGASLFIFNGEIKSRDWPTVSAKVTHVAERIDSENGLMYTPTVEYMVDGTSYRVTSRSSSSMRETLGSTKTVRYNPSNPAEGVLAWTGASFVFLLFPIIGVGMIIGSVYGLVASSKRSAVINQLKQTGMKLQGIVTDVQSGSGRGSVVLMVSAQDQSGQVRTFKSDTVSGNTFSLTTYKEKPVAIDVYVESSNPDNYYVDIDDVPEMTGDMIKELLQKAAGSSPFGSGPTTATVQPPQPVAPLVTTPLAVPRPTNPVVGTDNTVAPSEQNYR